MKRDPGILFFGLIEFLIGFITLAAVSVSLILGQNTKPPAVLVFVLLTSVTSSLLGIGLFRQSRNAYNYLLFFATIVIASKILIFFNVITLSGALETSVPASVKNTVSVIYHAILIFYLKRAAIRKRFQERRKGLFSLKFPLGR